MFPIDPNAPGGPARSDSLRRSYVDHTLVRERLPTRRAEPLPRAAVNGIARSPRADRSPFESHGAVAA
jgi:hypothetical protein